MLKILWKRGEIAPEEQFLILSTIFCYRVLDFYVKTGIRFSLRDKRIFEITEVEITRVDCTTPRPANGEVHFSDIQCHDCCFVCHLIRQFVNLVTLWLFLTCLLNSFTPQNLYVDTKTIILARILKKISGILYFGGHLVHHFVYLICLK